MLTDEETSVTIFRNKEPLKTYSVKAETMKDSKGSSVPLTMDTLFEQAKSDLDQGIVK